MPLWEYVCVTHTNNKLFAVKSHSVNITIQTGQTNSAGEVKSKYIHMLLSLQTLICTHVPT